MKVSLSWLREFVDLPESVAEIRATLDDLGLVVEDIENVGEGLSGVVVARVEEIHGIKGADRIRLVVVDAGDDKLEIVCGAMNFEVGNHVPLARVGTVLPGGFTITERTMKGIVSNGMLCSARELMLSEDHEGLLILDDIALPVAGQALMETLDIAEDVVFDISIEGNRPDAWSVEGVARDLALRFERELRLPKLATEHSTAQSSQEARAFIEAPDLCGRFTLSVLKNVKVTTSPTWVRRRLTSAGMRPISNVVDASNLVMLELGQPTHPYDAARVAQKAIGVRQARSGETMTTLDGTERILSTRSHGLGDTGIDCVIVDGDDQIIGLAGVMGGASTGVGTDTTEVLFEAAYFDPMTIARSSKRHALRSEASNRFERGVDPELALRATARFVEVLRESVPELEWLADPLDIRGNIPLRAQHDIRAGDVKRLLGVDIDLEDIARLLSGLRFSVERQGEKLVVTAPSSRPDVRIGAAGRADVIEEVARLYGYSKIERQHPLWAEPGALSDRQKQRRHLRDVLVSLGVLEAWTPTLISDEEFEYLSPGVERVRITNPLSVEESVLRSTLVGGLISAWSKNFDRGLTEVMLGEFGTVFHHPLASERPRITQGGSGGGVELSLPEENERLCVVLGRKSDDALSAVALWSQISASMGLEDVEVHSSEDVALAFHPTRFARLRDRRSGALVGFVGEVDPEIIKESTHSSRDRRIGLIDIDLDVLFDKTLTTRRSELVVVPSRYPSAVLDFTFVTARHIRASEVKHALLGASQYVETVTLVDTFSPDVVDLARSLTFRVRLSSSERTLLESDVAICHSNLIEAGAAIGAQLRSE